MFKQPSINEVMSKCVTSGNKLRLWLCQNTVHHEENDINQKLLQ